VVKVKLRGAVRLHSRGGARLDGTHRGPRARFPPSTWPASRPRP
jgi:hypothetical protein